MRSLTRLLSLAMTAVLPLLWAAPADAGAPYTFDLRIGETCQYGTGPASQNLHVLLASTSGHQLQKLTETADSSGNWGACFSTSLTPRMTVTAKHAGVHRGVTVPTLSISADRVTNVVSGSSPLGASTSVAAMFCAFQGNCTQHSYTVVANSSGHYRMDLGAQSPAWDVQGGDYLDLQDHDSDGDLFEVPMRAPSMIVVYPSLVLVEDAPVGSSQTVTLKSSAGTLRATNTKTITVTGANNFGLHSHGADVTIHTGDVINASFASDAHFSWHATLTGHTATGHVSGSCFDSAPIVVGVTTQTGGSHLFGSTASNGTFDLDFSGNGGVHGGDTLDVECGAPTGDDLTYAVTVP